MDNVTNKYKLVGFVLGLVFKTMFAMSGMNYFSSVRRNAVYLRKARSLWHQ